MAPEPTSASVYNSTFTLHRLSPLHVRKVQEFLLVPSISNCARQLTVALKGDLAYGVNLLSGEQDEDVGRLGPLKSCRWTLLGNKSSSTDTAAIADGLGILDGIKIDIEYEKASYVALLLKSARSTGSSRDTELHLPLLLSRMPAPVRSGLLDFLAVSFDTRAEMLRLSTRFMTDALENFIKELAEDSEDLDNIVKEVQLSLGFKAPVQANLRTLDVAIRREDVDRFLAHGKINDARSRDSSGDTGRPFMTSLRQYFSTHLALNIDHKQVFISRIACGAFALGREGKVKIFEPASTEEDEDPVDLSTPHKKAVAGLLQSLLSAATGWNGSQMEE